MNVRLYSAQYVRTVFITIFSSIICYWLVSILFCQCLSIIVSLRNKAPSFLLNVLLVILLFDFQRNVVFPTERNSFHWSETRYEQLLSITENKLKKCYWGDPSTLRTERRTVQFQLNRMQKTWKRTEPLTDSISLLYVCTVIWSTVRTCDAKQER